MQNKAHAHTTGPAQEEKSWCRIHKIDWTSFSPNLNTIESTSDEMKAYNDDHYPEEYGSEWLQFSSFREFTSEVCYSITFDQRLPHTKSMPVRW